MEPVIEWSDDDESQETFIIRWLERPPQGPAIDPNDNSLLARYVRGEWEPS